MKKPMLESIKTILKEWDSSDILDAAFNAASYYGEDPDWSDIISDMVNRIPEAKLKKIMKDQGFTDMDAFYGSLYDNDPDSVISYLEGYLTKKDIKEIIDRFPSPEEDEEYYDEEGEE